MASASSRKVVIAALLGNSAIAVTKFSAAAYTGSSAMLSEAVHSLVDTGNQGLLLFGMARAKRPATAEHPFGHAKELYFWSFVVAILIFGLGAGISIYEGIESLRHPEPISNAFINYIVLSLAILFEGGSCYVALREFLRAKGDRSFFEAVRSGKDSSMFTVLFEDLAAMAGLLIALVGIWIGQTFGIPWADGAAAVCIGIVLAGVAVFLAYECHGLLIGEAADPAMVASIERLVARDRRIDKVRSVLTMHLGPQDILLTLDVAFQDSLSVPEVEATIIELEKRIRDRHAEVTRISIEARSLQGVGSRAS